MSESDIIFERLLAARIDRVGHRFSTRSIVDGVKCRRCLIDHDQALAVGADPGEYCSIEFDVAPDDEKLSDDALSRGIARELELMLSDHVGRIERVLIAGIGNPYLTVDALGAAIVDGVTIGKGVCALKPLTDGLTGIDSFDVIRGVVMTSRPDLVIAADTLRTDTVAGIGRSLQLTTAGIQAGSGSGKRGKKICYETLGVPVVALGVPLVAGADIQPNPYGTLVTSARCEAIITAFSTFINKVLNRVLEKIIK